MTEHTLGSPADPFERLLRLAVRVVPAADGAGVYLGDGEQRWVTAAATDPAAEAVGSGLPFGADLGTAGGEGPAVIVVEDLARDGRRPEWAALAGRHARRSLACVCTPVPAAAPVALACHAGSAGAIADLDRDDLVSLGALAAAVVEARTQAQRAENLSAALESNRRIGVAIGIVMARELVTADQAFERLRAASQRRHRKLRDLAEEVAATGELREA